MWKEKKTEIKSKLNQNYTNKPVKIAKTNLKLADSKGKPSIELLVWMYEPIYDSIYHAYPYMKHDIIHYHTYPYKFPYMTCIFIYADI